MRVVFQKHEPNFDFGDTGVIKNMAIGTVVEKLLQVFIIYWNDSIHKVGTV